MGHTLISKLKPNYLDRSELKYDILIIKRRKCSINKNFSPPFSFIKKIVNSSSLSRARRKLLENLTWKNGLSVLIVAIDNGDNLLYIPKNIEQSSLSITGVDASFSKLKKTQNLYANRFNLSLIQCCAQELPFLDNQFDIVLQMGNFNKIKNKIKAVKEMLRVAKPKTKLIISDRYIGYRTQEQIDAIEREILKHSYSCDISFLENNKFYAIEFIKDE